MRVFLLGLAFTVFTATACLAPSFDGLSSAGTASSAPGSNADGGSTSDAAPNPASPGPETPAASSTDAGSGGPRTFACEKNRCALGSEVCCGDAFGNTSCKPNGATCLSGLTRCADKSDCGDGQVCCVIDDIPTSQIAACRTSCEPTRIACDPSLTPTTCPDGKTCTGEAGMAGIPSCK